MKLKWVENTSIVHVPYVPNDLGQVDERGGIFIPLWYVAGNLVGTVAGAYHGYKRNDSVGWAIVWALLSGPFWPIAVPVMLAQGFGDRK